MNQREAREILFSIVASIPLAIGFFFFAFWLLPENCLIYEYRQIGFLCDGFDSGIPQPQPCPICRNETMRLFAQAIFGLGVISFSLPIIIHLIKKLRNPPILETKLFD